MKLNEILNEGSVIQGNFGNSNQKNTGIDIPQGYESFYVQKNKNNKTANIIGVKSNGDEVRLSTAPIELANALAKEYNSGGKGNTGIQRLSYAEAFGSPGLQAIKELKIKLSEKPYSFEYIRNNYKVNELQFKKLSKMVELNEYSSKEIFSTDYDDMNEENGPLKDAKFKDDTFIIKFTSGNRYLVDTTGSSSYIRNWAYLNF